MDRQNPSAASPSARVAQFQDLLANQLANGDISTQLSRSFRYIGMAECEHTVPSYIIAYSFVDDPSLQFYCLDQIVKLCKEEGSFGNFTEAIEFFNSIGHWNRVDELKADFYDRFPIRSRLYALLSPHS